MRSIALSSLVACLVLTTGCYKYAINVGQGGDMKAPPKTEWVHHYVAGIVGDATVDVSKLCGSPDATIHIERNLVDAVLADFTGGVLWTPSTVDVYCGNGAVGSLEIPAAARERLVRDERFLDVVDQLAPDRAGEAALLQARLQDNG